MTESYPPMFFYARSIRTVSRAWSLYVLVLSLVWTNWEMIISWSKKMRHLICHLKTCISACSRFRPIEKGSKGLLENPTTYLHSTESHTGPLIIIRKRKLKHSTQLLLYGEHLRTYQRKHPVTHLQPLVVNFSLSPHPSQLFPLLPQPSVHSFHFIMLLFLNLASSKRHSPI